VSYSTANKISNQSKYKRLHSVQPYGSPEGFLTNAEANEASDNELIENHDSRVILGNETRHALDLRISPVSTTQTSQVLTRHVNHIKPTLVELYYGINFRVHERSLISNGN